ncbi:hypothetical protein [Streptomyces chrestomyceticus]|uniref:hypothetical protein n=1 Tax=Streptomyces chrestomyceticus TaxID=68185 RepID=UPI0033D49D7A
MTVDDIDAPALGVMSQGELHSLALSLFPPCTFLPENPFRFLVIDDPVQSMDPAKVDGLARVLALLAEHRQVVVFPHDTRLPQALKYLRLPATVLTVDRRERSAVRVRSGYDPVKQALDDAKALARARDLPGDVVARVLPGLCRTALEAALLEPARRRLLGRGLPHAEIEQHVAKAHKLTELAPLALYGETDRVGETMTDLTRAYGQQATDHIRWCNKGSTKPYPSTTRRRSSAAPRTSRRRCAPCDHDPPGHAYPARTPAPAPRGHPASAAAHLAPRGTARGHGPVARHGHRLHRGRLAARRGTAAAPRPRRSPAPLLAGSQAATVLLSAARPGPVPGVLRRPRHGPPLVGDLGRPQPGLPLPRV